MHGYLINYHSLFLCRQVQDGMKSLYNTPVLWSVYILNLVLKWIEKEGGVEGMGILNMFDGTRRRSSA